MTDRLIELDFVISNFLIDAIFFRQKRSIFKSKTAAPAATGSNGGNGGNKKGLSLYKHKWNSTNEPDDFRYNFNSLILKVPT